MRTIADEVFAGSQAEHKTFHIVCILDGSGSMGSERDDVILGYNKFMDDQRAIPGDVYVTLIVFSDEYELLYERRHISEIPPLTSNTYVPSGLTALLDTVGYAMGLVKPSNDQVSVLIITDGEENSSSKFTKEQVQALVKEHTDRGVEFSYIGANVDNFDEQSANLGISTAQRTYNMPDGSITQFSTVTNFAGAQSVCRAFSSASSMSTSRRRAVSHSTTDDGYSTHAHTS